MSDSADMKLAADRLSQALQGLEQAVNPMVSDLAAYKKQAGESEGLANDRAKLAQELDDSKAREDKFKDREVDFNKLADETTAELDQVIAQVRNVLERD